MQITGGKVLFSRTVQPAQYESKKAEAELTFTLGEGEKLDDTLQRVNAMVREEVLRVLALRDNEDRVERRSDRREERRPPRFGGRDLDLDD